MIIYLPQSLKEKLTETNKRGKIIKEAPESFRSDSYKVLADEGYRGLYSYTHLIHSPTLNPIIRPDNITIKYIPDEIYFNNLNNIQVEQAIKIEELEKDKKELDKLKSSINNIKESLID